ncbi:MAG: hypothetical protein SPG61_01305 [Arcanobacterium sp.]|nr:hypothetical protein [Arcanobacterium sp.]
MSTPTDPYNSASRRPFEDDEELLAPIADDVASADNSAELPYGDADSLVWDQVFTAESAAVAAGVESADESSEAEAVIAYGSSETNSDSESLTPIALDADASPAAAVSAPPMPPAFLAEAETTPSELSGYNALPEEARANATLGDVVSAHSADEVSFEERLTQLQAEEAAEKPVESGESFSSAFSHSLNDQAPAAPSAAEGLALAAATAATPAVAETSGFLGAKNEDSSRLSRWSEDPGAETTPVVPEAPKSRLGAHFGMLFLTLLLLPVAWYLVSDAGARLSLVENNPWATADFNIWALLELLGGFAVLGLTIYLASKSSLGAQLIGGLTAIAGLVAIIMPGTGKAVIAKLDAAIGGYNAFTGNIVHHLNLDLGSGRIALYGFIVFFVGLTAHVARRRGAERSEITTRRELLLNKND